MQGKKRQRIWFPDTIVNQPNSTRLLEKSVNAAANIYIFFAGRMKLSGRIKINDKLHHQTIISLPGLSLASFFWFLKLIKV